MKEWNTLSKQDEGFEEKEVESLSKIPKREIRQNPSPFH
jgi:hypothetical protein